MTSVQVKTSWLCNDQAKSSCYKKALEVFIQHSWTYSLKDIVLTSKQLDGEEVIPLKFVKFQNVQVPPSYPFQWHQLWGQQWWVSRIHWFPSFLRTFSFSWAITRAVTMLLRCIEIFKLFFDCNVFHQIDYLMLLGMPQQTTNMKVSLWTILKSNIITLNPELFCSGSEESRMRLGWHCLLQPWSELLEFASITLFLHLSSFSGAMLPIVYCSNEGPASCTFDVVQALC